FTPRVRAGDVVTLRSRAGTDTVRVTDVRLTEGPVLVDASSFTIKGTVTPRVPVGQLVAEARTNDPVRFRPLAPGDKDGVTGTITYDADTGGAFTATFTGMNADQRAAFDNLSEPSVQHAPAANEGTIATAIGEPDPAPGPGCATTAPVVDEAVTRVLPSVIGVRDAGSGLRVQGFVLNGGAVTVSLSDRDGTTRTLPATLDATAGTWRASAPATALAGLTGRITVAVQVDGAATGVPATFLRDLTAPRAPRTSVASGTYRRTQFVSLSAGAGDRIRYTLGDGGQAAPTRTRGTLYRGGQVRVARSLTLKAIAVDAAGNTSPVTRRDYRIR
ncbi:MAG TPA: chitobiase/beta-hexosaminidase C-terminal domain-containing protein, partial [Nocardioides sp.]